jgi:hypothetical protein
MTALLINLNRDAVLMLQNTRVLLEKELVAIHPKKYWIIYHYFVSDAG